ncbi:MAG: iron-containing alcohol dehydrogenase [Clostridia bacterium]|nr:iron-containing alcohol dehydrogenase [Clostridia bacterium]
MTTNKQFTKYLAHDEDLVQSVYVGSESDYAVIPELKKRGTKRILFMCDSITRRQREFDIIIDRYKDAGFRVFVYCRVDSYTTNRDVEGGLKIYREYNCDTIFVVGGNADIYCAKLVAARASDPEKDLSMFVGINKIKRKKTCIVCLATICNVAVSDSYSVYYDTNNNTLNFLVSNKLIPDIALLGSDLFMRNSMDEINRSILMSLCTGIESYLSDYTDRYVEYKACALNSCLGFLNTIDKFINNTSKTYYQEKLLVAGYYAGIASRKAGIGAARIIMHVLINMYGMEYRLMLDEYFPQVIQAMMALDNHGLADLSRKTYFSTMSSDDKNASQALLDGLFRIYKKAGTKKNKYVISSKDVNKLESMIVKELNVYGLNGILSSKSIYQILSPYIVD